MGCEGKSEIIWHGIECDKRGLGCKVYTCRLIFNTSNIFQISVYQTISFVCLTHSNFVAFFIRRSFYRLRLVICVFVCLCTYNYYLCPVWNVTLCFAVEHNYVLT